MTPGNRPGSTVSTRVQQVRAGRVSTQKDVLATEEPLEIRVLVGDGHSGQRGNRRSGGASVAVTMRTPGHDFELAAGFLFSEGLLRHADDVAQLRYCVDPAVDGSQQYNIVNVVLQPGVPFDTERLQRNFYATSSCGLCGKASLEAIRVGGCRPVGEGPELKADVVCGLPEKLRASQTIFERTGGLHAAGLFDPTGELITVREDVGRHNAVDKLIGEALLGRRLPLQDHVLVVSGRTSFEIAQKAAVAGIPIVAAVSAPSSLAVELAREFNMTLLGFVRGDGFNVYTGTQRIVNVDNGDRVGGHPKARRGQRSAWMRGEPHGETSVQTSVGADNRDGRTPVVPTGGPAGRVPAFLCVVGHSGSGKTTLIERLLPEFRTAGVRVASLKHAPHGFEIEPAGTDSRRHRRAGAETAMVYGPNQFALVASTPGQIEPAELARLAQEATGGQIDLVLIEGHKRSSYPKVLVQHPQPEEQIGLKELAAVIAVVSPRDSDAGGVGAGAGSGTIDASAPHFSWDDIPGLAEHLLNTVELSAGARSRQRETLQP